ncbi:2'-5' RNA ligase family protein [Myxococcota bacterium]|nr:2'-5' RNA ligase family protein [Myxococcota bacterium]MBU1535403.1 2'-5' RNA ligase family protein [Myxococcota bacterium]
MDKELITVISFLDGEVGTRVREYWDILDKEMGASAVRIFDQPSITLQGGLIDQENLSVLTQNFQRFGEKVKPYTIEISELGSIEEHSIYLKVQPPDEIRAVNIVVNTFLGIFCSELMGDYAPESFIPHVPLALNDLSPATFHRAMDRFSGMPLLLSQTVTNLCLMKFEEDGHLTLLKRAELKSPG